MQLHEALASGDLSTAPAVAEVTPPRAVIPRGGRDAQTHHDSPPLPRCARSGPTPHCDEPSNRPTLGKGTRMKSLTAAGRLQRIGGGHRDPDDPRRPRGAAAGRRRRRRRRRPPGRRLARDRGSAGRSGSRCTHSRSAGPATTAATTRATSDPPTTEHRRRVLSGYNARRPERARPSVSSSANSRSPPIGQARGGTRDRQAGEVAQQAHQVGGRRLALGVGVGGDDDLRDVGLVRRRAACRPAGRAAHGCAASRARRRPAGPAHRRGRGSGP